MIRAWKDVCPRLGARAWVDVSAQVIGDVVLGEDASVWMNTVVRGDVNRISIGARTNVQDNSVLHVTAEHPTALAGLRRYALDYLGYEEEYRRAEEGR
jgi:carbonic anhydrase/acetyltransferase-like protein (isoleucine patch superfamily)